MYTMSRFLKDLLRPGGVHRQAMSHWDLDDIDWQAFDRSSVDPDMVRIVKAASLVEYNGDLYGRYLANIFAGDDAFVTAAETWATEEVRHGIALGRWATMVDPEWDFRTARERFRFEYNQVDLSLENSVRGSRFSELVARCIVEVGTSSYYTALADATKEPVLRQIFRKIAADEFRHYKLFYDHMKRYRAIDNPNLLTRVRVAVTRLAESEDDELAFAYYIANDVPEAYDRKACAAAYGSRALPHYRRNHIRLAVNMTTKAMGLRPKSRVASLIAWVVCRLFEWRRQRLLHQAPAY